MYAYPITFTNADGTKVTGELVTEVTLQTQSWTIIPAPNGIEYSGYPFGTGVPAPTWTTVPSLLNQNSAVSVNILTTYVTPTTGVTLALNGSLPTGWAFNTGTNLLTYNGTSVSGPATVSFTATLTSTSATSQSNSFTVSGVGTTGGDTTAPTVPLAVQASSITQTAATLSWLPSSDPAPAGAAWSGMNQYNVTVTGAAGSPFTVSSAVGNNPTLIFTDIGTQTSTIVQTGASLAFTTTAVDAPYPTNSALAFAYQPLTATSFILSCEISAFSATGSYDNVTITVRPDLTPGGQFVSVGTHPFSQGAGAFMNYRATAAGSETTQGSVANTTSPIWLFLLCNTATNTYSGYYSLSGNAPIPLGSVTQSMGGTLNVGFGANSSDGVSFSVTATQVNIQTLANPTLALSGLSSGTNYPVAITAQDVTGNISSSSASYSFSTPSSSGLPSMPITSFYAINGPQATNFSSSSWQQWASRFNIITMMNYVGIENGMNGVTMSQSMGAVKGYAGSRFCKTGFYQIMNSLSQTATSRPALWTLFNSTTNWLLLNGGQVQYAGASIPNGCANTNGSALSPLKSGGWANGLDTCYALADYTWNTFINGSQANVGETGNGTCAANPNADFIMLDNQFWDIWASGNWLYGSTIYTANLYNETSPSVICANLQAGYARIVTRLRAHAPNLLIMGNATNMVSGYSVNQPSELGLYDIPFGEQMIGNSNSVMQYVSPNVTLQRMAKNEQIKSTNALAIPIFSVGENGPFPGVAWPSTQTPSSWATINTSTSTMATNSGSAYWTASFWQAARYGLCFALLRNWAFDLTAFTQAPYWTTPPWMDEYSQGASGVWNWLGNRISALVTGVTSTDIANGTNLNIGGKSVYFVRFANGYVYLNCIGNGQVTIPSGNIPGGACHYLTNGGYSDPSTPYGTQVTSFVLKDGDARIMLP